MQNFEVGQRVEHGGQPATVVRRQTASNGVEVVEIVTDDGASRIVMADSLRAA